MHKSLPVLLHALLKRVTTTLKSSHGREDLTPLGSFLENVAPFPEYVLLLQSNGHSAGVLNPPYRGNSAGVMIALHFNSELSIITNNAVESIQHSQNIISINRESKCLQQISLSDVCSLLNIQITVITEMIF